MYVHRSNFSNLDGPRLQAHHLGVKLRVTVRPRSVGPRAHPANFFCREQTLRC